MGLFDKVFGKSQSQKEADIHRLAEVLFAINVMSAGEVFDEESDKTKGGIFEGILLASITTLKSVKYEKPATYALFEKKYMSLIGRAAVKSGVDELIDGDFSKFVNNRFQLYGKINHGAADLEGNMNKVVYNIFENPLQFESGFSTNLIENLQRMLAITTLIQVVNGKREIAYKEIGM